MSEAHHTPTHMADFLASPRVAGAISQTIHTYIGVVVVDFRGQWM